MKKIFATKWIALVMALTLVCGLTTPWSQAAQSCTVTFSDHPNITVGQQFTVNVMVRGAVAIATVKVNYDSSYLQYVGGDLGYGYQSGNAIVMDKENTGTGNISFSMTFKALKAGSTTINNYENSIVDGNGDPMNITPGWSSITIAAPQTASGNNNLSSLSISPGTLSPGFSAGTTSYRASVSNSTTSVAVSAQPQDGKAKVAYWGNSGFKVGDNTITVQVTAENGAKKFYTITVNRAAGNDGGGGNTGGGTNTPDPGSTPTPTPTATPEPEVMVTLPDQTQLPIAQQLPEGVAIPAGFEQSQVEVEGKTFPAIVHGQGKLTAVYLQGNEAHAAGFYFLNTKTQEAWEMVQVPMSSGKLMLVDLPEDLAFPTGYSSTMMELGGQQHTLLIPDGVEAPNHYIVCALDEAGNMGLYLYDVEQQSFQRYQFLELPQEEPEETQEPQQEGFVFSILRWRIQTPWGDQVVSYVLVGLALLGVILLVAVVVLAVCLVRSRRALRNEWMYQEEQRQRQIIAGPNAADLTLDDILAEYKNQDSDQEQTLEEPQDSNQESDQS